jgi:hypothetical protein
MRLEMDKEFTEMFEDLKNLNDGITTQLETAGRRKNSVLNKYFDKYPEQLSPDTLFNKDEKGWFIMLKDKQEA